MTDDETLESIDRRLWNAEMLIAAFEAVLQDEYEQGYKAAMLTPYQIGRHDVVCKLLDEWRRLKGKYELGAE